jgi:sortase A
MAGNKRKRRANPFGTLMIFMGILCVLSAAGLAAYNWWDGQRAGEAAGKVAEVIREKLKPAPDETNEEDIPKEEESFQESFREMPTMTIDGLEYIGLLEIPSLSLSLPVMKEWDYDRLKTAPCRYSGSYFTNDLVICGHNYARHFSPLRGISMGSDVYFTNPEGLKIHYIADNIQTVDPTAIDEMIQNSPDGEPDNRWWDMTLFTCNLGGTTRCAVRCVRIEE